MIIFFLLQSIISYEKIPSSFTNDMNFSFTKYKPKSYRSLKQCIMKETIKHNSSALEIYNKITSETAFKDRLKEDFLYLLADKSIKLTSDEKAAIYLYAESKLFSEEFSKQARTGVIGHFNCYMDYLLSAFKKLKIPEQTLLFRGTGTYEALQLAKFRKDQTVTLDAYTSTSSNEITARRFAAEKTKFPTTLFDYTGGLVIITKMASNSRFLERLALPTEDEHLYPPLIKFKVMSNPELIFCKQYFSSFHECKPLNQIDKDADLSYMHKIVVVNVSEIDEQPKYIEIDNPYPDPDPTRTPSPSPNPTKTPKAKKCKSKVSCKDDGDDKNKKSSRILSDFEVKNAYIGASTIFDFDFYHKIKNFIPTPHFLHPAIWIGPSNPNNMSIGAVFVYGKYYPENNEKIFLSKNGAKSYTMTFGEFKEKYNYFDPISIIPQRNIKLFDLTNEIKSSGNWDANSYKWTTNNCQHFISKCIKILKAVRYCPNDKDWLKLPPRLLKELKLNEKKENGKNKQ